MSKENKEGGAVVEGKKKGTRVVIAVERRKEGGSCFKGTEEKA